MQNQPRGSRFEVITRKSEDVNGEILNIRKWRYQVIGGMRVGEGGCPSDHLSQSLERAGPADRRSQMEPSVELTQTGWPGSGSTKERDRSTQTLGPQQRCVTAVANPNPRCGTPQLTAGRFVQAPDAQRGAGSLHDWGRSRPAFVPEPGLRKR